MLSNLPSDTHHAINVTSPLATVALGFVAAITLNQIAVSLTIVSLLLNIGWMVVKFLYLNKRGADVMWGNGDD